MKNGSFPPEHHLKTPPSKLALTLNTPLHNGLTTPPKHKKKKKQGEPELETIPQDEERDENSTGPGRGGKSEKAQKSAKKQSAHEEINISDQNVKQHRKNAHDIGSETHATNDAPGEKRGFLGSIIGTLFCCSRQRVRKASIDLSPKTDKMNRTV